MDVTGQKAIVTGGGRSIGRGIVMALARHGADVVVADINLDDARSVASEVSGAGRQSLATSVDVTKQESVERMVGDVIERFGQIDILVNNAGVIGAPGWESREDLTPDDWDMIYDVNVKGVARVTEAVARHMKERRYGKIVNISSIAGRSGSQVNLAYGASKAAVINLTQATALQFGPFNINVNAICPGLLWTPLWHKIGEHVSSSSANKEGLGPREVFDRRIKATTPLGREQTPEDIGNAVAFLASESARNITGQAINVSGGSHLN
jgi:NAD(P)-dependent dehydrogenase (short-subunit alcohol dehydrogenase family)